MKKRQYTTRKLVVTLPLICGTEERLLRLFLERLPKDIATTRNGTEVCVPFDECADLLGFDETDADLARETILKALGEIQAEIVKVNGYGYRLDFNFTTRGGINDDGVYIKFDTSYAASAAYLQYLKQEEELKNAE